MKRYIIDTEIPEFIEKLRFLIGKDIVDNDKSHFLYNHFREFDNWANNKDMSSIPRKVVSLSGYSVNIFSFKRDWQNPSIKKYLQHKLRERQLVKGILYEFRAATHFAIKNKSVTWLPNLTTDSEADLRIETHQGAIVNVECTRKHEKENRLSSLEKFYDDVISTIDYKSYQRKKDKFARPLLVAVFFPETIDWEREDIRLPLAERLQSMFKLKEGGNYVFANISGVALVSFEEPSLSRNKSGILYHDTSLPAIHFTNSYAECQLPDDLYYLQKS